MSEPTFESLEAAAGTVSRETFEELCVFAERFQQWNRRINLASPDSLKNLWTRHIVDSAQLSRLAPLNANWIDIGSGGGFPGLVMAFLMKAAGGNIRLVESNRKKAGFLAAISGEFELSAKVEAMRIEDAVQKLGRPDILTARALAPLADLLALTEPWLEGGYSRALFHKGRDYRGEIEESSRKWRFDLLEHPSVTDPDAVILEIQNVSRR